LIPEHDWQMKTLSLPRAPAAYVRVQTAGAAGNSHRYRIPHAAYQFGVERQWGFTGTLLRFPPGFLRLYGVTGTIFLPFCVLAIRNHLLLAVYIIHYFSLFVNRWQGLQLADIPGWGREARPLG
jgi:hypothetical protein